MWCSVDLRDGNQALMDSMTVEQKLELFDTLVACGLKEIEVGFPAAAAVEYEFIRRLIDEQRIPGDVTIQVLTQAREEQIKKTIESLVGARRVIIHLYNSTSPVQRRVVFGLKEPEIVAIAVQGAEWAKAYAERLLAGTEVVYEYSPESFSATETDFALRVCDAVMGVFQPTPERKMIINLPATVELAMPHVYADQIEYFCRNMLRRDTAIISVHTHNDRGCAVAATEFGLLAGADRVEGTLFGNGERTGNCDLVTVALNMFSDGVDPELDFSNLPAIREVYERCTSMAVDPRHPYAGSLVFTAFSGGHQDAIAKAFEAREEGEVWDNPYLGIDPSDIGCTYEPIRINSQSGKGGVAYRLEKDCGIRLPKDMVREFGLVVAPLIEALGREALPADLARMFRKEYIERTSPYRLVSFHSSDDTNGCLIRATVQRGELVFPVTGVGKGPIDAFVRALREAGVVDVNVVDEAQHSLGDDESAPAMTYVKLQLCNGRSGQGDPVRWGAGVDTSTTMSALSAILSALNRS